MVSSTKPASFSVSVWIATCTSCSSATARAVSSAAAQQRRQPGADRVGDELRTDEVDVRVEPAGGDDLALARDDLGAGADDHARGDAGHDVGVARLADADDAALADADVRLHDPPV